MLPVSGLAHVKRNEVTGLPWWGWTIAVVGGWILGIGVAIGMIVREEDP